MSLIGKFMSSMMDEGGYDAVVAFFTVVAGSRMVSDKLIETLRDIRARYASAPMVLSIVAPDEIVRTYEAAGYTILEDPARAVRAAAAMVHFGMAFKRGVGRPAAGASGRCGPCSGPDRRRGGSEANPRSGRRSDGRNQACRNAGRCRGRLAGDRRPAAMKIVSPDILHKTEIGGVRLDVGSAPEAARAFSEITEAARRHHPDANIEGVILSEMVTGGRRNRTRGHQRPDLRAAVMFGLGGVFRRGAG